MPVGLHDRYISVIGAFSTIVPIILAFFSDKMDMLRYASFSTGDAVFAYSATMRTFDESTHFCESLWMQPASFDSWEQLEGVMVLIEAEMTTYIGAVRNTSDEIDAQPQPFRWVDGSPWPPGLVLRDPTVEPESDVPGAIRDSTRPDLGYLMTRQRGGLQLFATRGT